jgi:hypothetical protein
MLKVMLTPSGATRDLAVRRTYRQPHGALAANRLGSS